MEIMEMMKSVIKQAWEETTDAKRYIDKATKYKEMFPYLAMVYKELAPVEISHADKIISGFETDMQRASNVPNECHIIWSFFKEQIADMQTEIKSDISHYATK